MRRLRMLEVARRRLRDMAAGAYGNAQTETLRLVGLQAEAETERERLLDDMPGRLQAASGAAALYLVGDERAGADWQVARAAQAAQQAARSSEVRRDELRIRESQLRGAERLVERAREDRNTAERRDEQRAVDDIVAAARARGPAGEGGGR